jgi:hypothetical protein
MFGKAKPPAGQSRCDERLLEEVGRADPSVAPATWATLAEPTLGINARASVVWRGDGRKKR